MATIPNNEYGNRVDSTDPSMPYGKAKNIVGTTKGTGTPLEEKWVNDLFGFQQAILQQSGLTPSGTPDTADSSQYLEGVKKIVGVDDLSVPYVFDTVAAMADSTLVFPVGKVLELKERATGIGGGANWDVVLTTSVTPNTYWIVQSVGVPTLSFVLRKNIDNSVTSKQFGSTSNASTTPNLQAFIDYVGDNNLTGIIVGSASFNQDIFWHRNSNIIGVEGLSFGSSLIPFGNAKIRFDGDLETGGFVFHASIRNVVINGLQSTLSAGDVIELNMTYSITLKIRMENFDTSSNPITLLNIHESNDIELDHPIIFGSSSGAGTGILIGTNSTVKINNPDVEVLNRGIKVNGDEFTRVDITGLYSERNLVHLEHLGTGELNIYGGEAKNPNSGSILAILNAKTNVYGLAGTLAAGQSSSGGITSTSATNPDVNLYGVDDSIIGGSWFTGANMSASKGGLFTYNKLMTKESLADDTYIDLVEIENATANSSSIVELSLWCSSAGFGKAYKIFKFMVVKESGGNYVASVINETDMRQSSSGNFSIDVFMNLVLTASGATIQGKFTAIGAVNPGDANNLKASVYIASESNNTKLKSL